MKDWESIPAPCNDCSAEVGTSHERGCDVARCMWTGQQRIQCDGGLAASCCYALRQAGHSDLADDLAYYLGLDDPLHDCGEDLWTGQWPGNDDAAEMGLWTYWGPPWIECGPDHPQARPDLNKLALAGKWDRGQKKWVRR